jgi:predicted  nucleic acid-binding Zn-ribbon protein
MTDMTKKKRAPRPKMPVKPKAPQNRERTRDLRDVEKNIEKANTGINTIVAKLREYEGQVQKVIKELYEKAGLLEQMEELETQLQLARNRAQEKVNVLRADLQRFGSVRQFLVDKMTGETPVAPDPPTEAKTPDPAIEGVDGDSEETPEEQEDKSDEGTEVPPAPEF